GRVRTPIPIPRRIQKEKEEETRGTVTPAPASTSQPAVVAAPPARGGAGVGSSKNGNGDEAELMPPSRAEAPLEWFNKCVEARDERGCISDGFYDHVADPQQCPTHDRRRQQRLREEAFR